MEIKVRIDGDPNGQMAVSVSHGLALAGGLHYSYGACALEDVPTIVAAALEEIVKEIQELAGLDPAERTQAKAHEIWLEGQKGE